MSGKIKEVVFLAIIIGFFLISNSTNAVENQENFVVIHDIKGNSNWLNHEPVEVNMEKNSTVIFEIFYEDTNKDETCKLALTEIQRVIKSAIFSLECLGQNSLPILARRDTLKEIDVDYNDKPDFTLLLKKIDLKEEKITIEISKFTEEKKKDNNFVLILIIIFTLIALGLDFYYHRKINQANYKKIKELLEKVEEYLSLKNHKKAKELYEEVKTLHKKLTSKQKKELQKQVSELFRQFKDEEKIITDSKI